MNQKEQKSVVDKPWRIPTIMELSMFLHLHRWDISGQLWSTTRYFRSDHYWTGSWRYEQTCAVYDIIPNIQELDCIFVRTNDTILEWSRPHWEILFGRAEMLALTLQLDTPVMYNCPRPATSPTITEVNK